MGASSTAAAGVEGHDIVFVGGLHRSGTTLLARCMSEHALASGFRNTGVIEDEGQFLQDVYPPAHRFGGPGRFGFSEEAHLTERSPGAGAEAGARMFASWSSHWDMTRRVLIEKSPPNILKTRYLQACFPAARFVVCVRHPAAVALATSKWTRRWPVDRHVEHWVRCHEILREDACHVERLLVVCYESFVDEPSRVLGEIDRFIGIPEHTTGLEIRGGINDAYFRRWSRLRGSLLKGRAVRRAIARCESRVRSLGYSLDDLSVCDVESCWRC